MPRTRKEHERKQTGVSWPDVWRWAEELEHSWGYNTVVKVCRPLSAQRQVMAVVVVELTKLKVTDPQMNSTMKVWRNVRYGDVSVEAMAMQLIAEVDAKLDREAWSAERAAWESGAMF